MKKLIACITIFGIFCSTGIFAQDDLCMPEMPEVYYDETDDCFNKGKFVGKESDDYLKAIRRIKYKNWSLAAGTTAIGILTLILVGKNHHKRDFNTTPIENN